jgi:hypothetical protein
MTRLVKILHSLPLTKKPSLFSYQNLLRLIQSLHERLHVRYSRLSLRLQGAYHICGVERRGQYNACCVQSAQAVLHGFALFLVKLPLLFQALVLVVRNDLVGFFSHAEGFDVCADLVVKQGDHGWHFLFGHWGIHHFP